MPNGIRGGRIATTNWAVNNPWVSGPTAYVTTYINAEEYIAEYNTYGVPRQDKPNPAVKLFIGGALDGRIMNIGSYRVWSTVSLNRLDYTIGTYPTTTVHNYKLRTYTNPEGESFSVMVLDSLRGYEVLQMLASKDYKNNPLKAKNKA